MCANYLGRLNASYKTKDGSSVVEHLSLDNPTLNKFATLRSEASVENDSGRSIDDQILREVAVMHWKVAEQLFKFEDYQKAFELRIKFLVLINRIAERTDSWFLPVMYMATKEVVQLSVKANSQLSSLTNISQRSKKQKENLELATRTINRCFTISLNDRSTNVKTFKKWGVYFFVGELFKMYFKLDARSLAKTVLKVLTTKQSELPPLQKYPKSHIATFLYYSGLIYFMDEDYENAAKKLKSALSMCHKTSTKNKELILVYLIPSMFLVTKKTPSKYLLESTSEKEPKEGAANYPALRYLYKDLFDALLAGNLHAFNTVLHSRRPIYVKKHLYLAITRIKSLVYTRLFKKTYLVMGKPTRMEMCTFSKALAVAVKMSNEELEKELETGRIRRSIAKKGRDPQSEHEKDTGTESDESKDENKDDGVEHTSGLSYFGMNKQDVSSDQVECYLTKMICDGDVKGYISRERLTLVLSSKNAFPKKIRAL